MQIYINNKLAVLKSGTSFDFISENRAFTGSDSYTLAISFPLKDCPQNIAIFGHIYRNDVSVKKLVFDCELRHNNFVKFGSLTITKASESEVSAQFLAGRSEVNFSKILENQLICDLDLGEPAFTKASEISPTQAWEASDVAVALPWVNMASGIIQNCAECVDNVYSWSDDTKKVGISWMPYLIHIAKKICSAIGYSYDFSEWENSQWKWLLCCNAIPASWDTPGFADALPAWSVGEFFEQLELLLDGEFDFDLRLKKISFRFTSSLIKDLHPINISDVVNALDRDVKASDPDCNYIRSRNIFYADADFDLWNFYSCPWFINSKADSAIVYDTLDELLAYLKDNISSTADNRPSYDGFRPAGSGATIRHAPAISDGSASEGELNTPTYRGEERVEFFFCRDTNCYYVLHTLRKILVKENVDIPNEYILVQELLSVNAFGPRPAVNPDEIELDSDNNDVEIKLVPVCLDDTDEVFGRCAFLPFSATDNGTTPAERPSGIQTPEERKKDADVAIPQVRTFLQIKAGDKDNASQPYSQIFVGFWNGSSAQPGKLPYPIIDSPTIDENFNKFIFPFSLRLNNRISSEDSLPDIDPHHKVTFKFLAKDIPNVRAPFIICGKKYVCEKITATFTENGMSQLLKGVFYPVLES